MEIGAFFILVLVLVVVAVLGGGIWMTAGYLRKQKLGRGEDRGGRNARSDNGTRPRHVEAESEQRTRFVGTR
jgi:hypothetical protein